MTTNTAAVLPPARQDPRQVLNTLKQIINFGDLNASAGIAWANSLPAGAVIMMVISEVLTAFNAGGTNPITVGTTLLGTQIANGAGAGTDFDPTVVGATSVGRGLGGSLAAAADTPLYYSYVPTGGAATTGQARITIAYEGGWSS